MSNKVVVGMAHSASQADVIVRELGAAGFSDADLSILLPDRNVTRDLGHEAKTKAPEGAAAGAASGGLIGGAIGLLAGIGSLSIPGLGVFIAAGPILGALGGVGAGAAVGGITGALVGAGVPEYEAKFYEGKLRSGNILIAVHTENADEQKVAKDVFERAQATDISSTSEATASA